MKKIISQITILAAAFLFILNLNAKADENFNLNSITASDIGRSDGHSPRHGTQHSFEFSDALNKSGLFGWLKPKPQKPLAAKEWTVMIFMNAKNNLVKNAKKDIAEMKKIGTTKAVNILVQYGALNKKTKRMMIEKRMKDDNGFLSSGEVVYEKFKNVDMGDYKEVADFIKWSKINFPAKKYMLVLWNHGTGWIDPKMENENNPVPAGKGILFDDETQNYVKTNQMVEIFKMAGPVDIYVNNACLMQMAEIAYELKDYTKLIVGSEETMLAYGFNYEKFLKFLNSNTNASHEQISDFLINWYKDFYDNGIPVFLGLINIPLDSIGATLSTIKSSALNSLPKHLSDFAKTIMDNNETIAVKHAIQNAVRFQIDPANDPNKQTSSYVDLYDFARQVSLKAASGEVKIKANKLMSFISSELIVRTIGINGDKVNGFDYSKAGGIAIEMTQRGTNIFPESAEIFETKYADLSLSRDSLWDEFLEWTDAVWAQ